MRTLLAMLLPICLLLPAGAQAAGRRPVVAVFDVQTSRYKLKRAQKEMLTNLLGQELGLQVTIEDTWGGDIVTAAIDVEILDRAGYQTDEYVSPQDGKTYFRQVLIEHEGPLRGYQGNPRLHFIAAAAFALMAILRLARFNLETGPEADKHTSFRGLPSPAAAGSVSATILFYLTMVRPEIEVDDGTPTPLGRALALFPEIKMYVPWWYLPALATLLPEFASDAEDAAQ